MKTALYFVNNPLDISKVENSEVEIMTVEITEKQNSKRKHKQEGGTQKNAPQFIVS